MSKSEDQLFSVKNEIAVHPELPHGQASPESDPAPDPGRDGSANSLYYRSAAFEPGSPLSPPERYEQAFRQESANCSPGMLLVTTFCCGLVGGLAAIPIVFTCAYISFFQIFMLVVFGPFAEEALKQCGMIYQMEKLPHTIRSGWQFFLAGTLGGLVFSILENLIYQHIYLRELPPENLAALMRLRWTVCLFLHIACTGVSAFGLRRVWLDSLKRKIPCQVSDAFPWFFAAMVIHGSYNLFVILFFDKIFRN